MAEETAWLVEYDGKMLATLGVKDMAESIQYLSVRPKGYGAGELTLHADPNRALRFSRKQDAEAVLTVYAGHTNRDSTSWIGNYLHAREHMWPAVPDGVPGLDEAQQLAIRNGHVLRDAPAGVQPTEGGRDAKD